MISRVRFLSVQVLLIVLDVTGSWAQSTEPVVPPQIAVPPGHSYMFELHAKGVQIYKSVMGKTGALEWVLVGPLANLYDDGGNAVGWHYEGPAWEATDGSKVVRDKATPIRSAPAPDPKSAIPWLLIGVKPEAGTAGKLAAAVYVQRRDTSGGSAPPQLPLHTGTQIGVPYSANYDFFRMAE